MNKCKSINELENEEIKAHLVGIITTIIKEKKLTQEEAALVMGVDQPKVSQLINNKHRSFSLYRIIRFLNDFGYDVSIIVKNSQKQIGEISIYHEPKL